MSTEGIGYRQKAAATKRKRTIRAIIEAARALFDEKGWHDVTRDEIAQAAGVGVATIHNNFGSKQAVALAAYASLLAPVVEAAESAAPEKGSNLAIGNFISELAEVAAQHPVLATALIEASLDRDAPQSTSPEVIVIDFNQLAELLELLVAGYWTGEKEPDRIYGDIAEVELSGLLMWILRHPGWPGAVIAPTVLIQLT